MPRYILDFVCTWNGRRTDGYQAVEMPNHLPSLQHAQQHFTERFQEIVRLNSGATITDLTITDIHLA